MNEEVFDLVLGNVLTAWGWGTPDTPLSTIPCSCHHSLLFTCHRLLYSLQLGTTLGRSEGRVRASRNSYSLFLCQIGGFLRNGSLGSPESMGLLCANALSLSRTWRLGLMGHVYARRWQWTETQAGSSLKCPRLPALRKLVRSLIKGSRVSVGLLFVRGIHVRLLTALAFV